MNKVIIIFSILLLIFIWLVGATETNRVEYNYSPILEESCQPDNRGCNGYYADLKMCQPPNRVEWIDENTQACVTPVKYPKGGLK